MRFFRQLLEQLRTVYGGMSRPRRVVLLTLTVGCIAVMIAVGVWAVQTDYQVLYSGLNAEDAGAVTAKLQAQSVPFRLSAGGGTILVPAERVHQLRLDLAVEGVPSKGKGFELFDEVNVGMTPFLQHVNLDRALQAELAKTIMQVEPVVQARVHLVRPEPTPFVREQKPASASVVLKLRPGAVLTRSTAQGIVALVSRSVEGLSPEHVTLVDTTGRVLSDTHGDTPGPVATQMEYRREMETYLSNRAEDMLAQLLGPGRAVVRVTAEVNFQHQKTRKESYDPEQRVLVKETITNRKSSTGAPPNRGTAGAVSNLPGKSTSTTPANTPHHSNDNEENTDSEWRATKIEQEMEEGKGNVERLTIAALLDLSRPEGAEGATLTVQEAEEIIKQAVGFKKGRDEIKVNDVKLASGTVLENVESEYQQAQRMRWYLSLARNASLGVAALVALMIGLLYYRRLRPKQPPAPVTEAPTSRDRLAELMRENPQRLAKVLSRWLEQTEAPAEAPAARAA